MSLWRCRGQGCKPQSSFLYLRAQKLAVHWQGVHVIPGGLYTSLSCAGSSFLEAEVGPVHSNFLAHLLCRIQTKSVRFGGTEEKHNQRSPSTLPIGPSLLDLCAWSLKKPGQLCTTSPALGYGHLAGKETVLAVGLPGWGTHKPRGSMYEVSDAALGFPLPPHCFTLAILGCLSSVPLRMMCFFHPQTFVYADLTGTNTLFVLPGPFTLTRQVSAWSAPFLGAGCPHPSAWSVSLF